MAFLLIAKIRGTRTSDLNKKYESHLNDNFHQFSIGINSKLYIENTGSTPQQFYREKLGEGGRIFHFGLPVFRSDNDTSAPLAGPYALIEEEVEKGENTIQINTDTLGFYPVFFMDTKDSIFISDRQEFIAAIYGKSLQSDKIAINEFCVSELINGNRSFYEKIKRLGIGEKIHISNNGITIDRITINLNIPVTKEQLLTHYKEVFSSMKDTHGTMGFKLSGGYDSRLCLALYLIHFDAKDAHCITHDTTSFDMDTAKKIAADYKIKQHFVTNDQSMKLYYQERSNNSGLDITGMCGEMCRSFYYKYSKKPDDLEHFLKQYIPLAKSFLLRKETVEFLKESVLNETERLQLDHGVKGEFFRVFDFIYLNRTRTMFSYQMTDARNNLFPLLIDEFWFRFRLSFSFEEIQRKKPYHEIFKTLDDRISNYPFIHFSLLQNNSKLLEISKLIRMQIHAARKSTKPITFDELGVMSKDVLHLINTYPYLDSNYRKVALTLKYAQDFVEVK